MKWKDQRTRGWESRISQRKWPLRKWRGVRTSRFIFRSPQLTRSDSPSAALPEREGGEWNERWFYQMLWKEKGEQERERKLMGGGLYVCVCWGNRLRAQKMQWHKSGLCWVSCFFIGLFPVVLSLKLLPLSLHSFCSQSRVSWMMLVRCQTSGFEI